MHAHGCSVAMVTGAPPALLVRTSRVRSGARTPLAEVQDAGGAIATRSTRALDSTSPVFTLRCLISIRTLGATPEAVS